MLPDEQWSLGSGISVHRVRVGCAVYKLLVLFVAVGYGGMLSQIPAEHFKDFGNYLIYAEHSWVRLLGMLDRGLLVTLSNEPVWLLINAGLGAFLTAETVVRIIIFGSATSVAWLVLRSDPRHFIWLLLFMLLPVVLKNHLVHLRQGAAIALFLWGWFSPSRTVRSVLMGVTPFVHASFFFVLAVHLVAKGARCLKLGPDVRTLVFGTMGVGVAFGLAWLASLLGARQVETYNFAMTDVSGLGFVFWLLVFVIMVMDGRRFLREHAFETGIIVFYLSTYWLIEITARIFESGMLLVLLAGLALTGWRRPAFLVAIIVYGIMTWLLRMGQPAMGFAGG
ncbi:MAG: hypothetical protein CMK32_04355 [Porticoccaceae bacterium]|nr:hypothetical protein [Porticoccaceae bacterium]